jgi:hypothetical protein
MFAETRSLLRVVGLTFVALLTAASCGGGSGGGTPSVGSGTGTGTTTPPPSVTNVLSVAVGPGPSSLSSPAVNTLYASVTVCAPGSTTSCQTIDNIEIDTGSFGLRLLASALTVSLPVQAAGTGSSLVECTEFADGYSWGPVALADVQIAGETASSVPVQVIGSANFTIVPADCSGTGTAEDTVAEFGANGVLGVGVFAQDCGAGCVPAPNTPPEPQAYYACNSAQSCTAVAVPLANQVTNPVTMFATDNNGVIIQLASVPAAGAQSVSGDLIFGVDTESNNASGNQTVLTVNAAVGDFTTVYSGQTLSSSFLDTGSNGLYFDDSTIAQCPSPYTGFYCPAATDNLTAVLQGQDASGLAEGTTASVNFSVANAETLGNDEPTYIAFGNLAGTLPPNGNTPLTNAFDWGLPFFYGQTVYTVIQGYTTTVGTGPYVAF